MSLIKIGGLLTNVHLGENGIWKCICSNCCTMLSEDYVNVTHEVNVGVQVELQCGNAKYSLYS